jgi:SNF2 family DNA or RNA helicase
MNINDLHNYQKRAIAFVCEKNRCALWIDMGLGKSCIALSATVNLLEACIISKCLVIAPLRVANSVWKQEAAKWDHLKHLHISICTGSVKERKAGFNKKADIYIINRENVTWLIDLYIEKKKKWDFDCVVLDEAGSFRDSSTSRYKSIKKIIKYTTVMIELTGTPAPNGLPGLRSQMFLLDFGASLGKTKDGFEKRFFTKSFNGYKLEPKPGAKEEIYSLIGHQVLSMSGEDYLELPSRINLVETVVMPKELVQQYKKLKSTLLLKIKKDIVIDAVNSAVLANKLLQFANGAIYVDEKHNWEELHTLKLDAFEELIEENDGENILVAYNYKHDLIRIKKRFPTAVHLDKKQKTIDQWNDGKIKLLVAHPASCGHGINLQNGGSILIWFGLTWDLELYQQMNARLYRQGQKKPVRIIHIIAKDTYDERAVSVLTDKNAVQYDLLNALR